MAGVIIEELDNSSEDSYGSPYAHSDRAADKSDDEFHPCEDEASQSPQPASSSSEHEQLANGTPPTRVVEQAAPPSEEERDGVSTASTEPAASAGDEEKVAEAERHKLEGNALYGSGKFQEALEAYQEALSVSPESASQQRAVYYANAGAAQLKLEDFAGAARDCGAALALEPPESLQIKALTRRSLAYEKLDDLERAFADHQKLVQLDPQNSTSAAAIRRLKPVVEERQQKMKDEMIDKLKELGNTMLGKFGMSFDNFTADKDPQTGSYSINFKQ